MDPQIRIHTKMSWIRNTGLTRWRGFFWPGRLDLAQIRPPDPDPDLLVRGMDPDPDPDAAIIKQN
jgi:hypothetical protein